MKIKGLTEQELNTCIDMVNARQNYRLIYNRRPERKGSYLHFTIRSEKSGIRGARTAPSGRNLVSASWHAHGYLFDEIFTVNEDAVIWSGGKKITPAGGNWEDWNVGSYNNPSYMSDLSIL